MNPTHLLQQHVQMKNKYRKFVWLSSLEFLRLSEVCWVGLLLKGVLLILMISSNTIGCTFFVKALNASGSSLPCTIASSATSYVCSALAGFLIFNESTSITWWCGISLVILGLFFISRVPAKSDSTEKLKQK
nr:transmembrane protein 42 isoform X5 [Megalopta genalis]XP_033326202.1 transmembrane protein 42 isoform X6 [Megalopta genalis]